MSKCTAAAALKAFEYYLQNGGYCEKRDGTAKYLTRDLDNFAANAGSGNWTWMGKLCGVNPGAWCAMMVSTALYEGCGNDRAAAKAVMWGVWPYTVVRQLWNAADDDHKFYGDYQRFTLGKGVRTRYVPEPGDVIIFTDDGSTLTHVGMVYAVDDTTVYSYEGNSSNRARKRSYSLKSSYVFGYVKLDYAPALTPTLVTEPEERYGPQLFQDPPLHELSKGVYGPEVGTIQRICYARGIKYTDADGTAKPIEVDDDFGRKTEECVRQLRAQLDLPVTNAEGKVRVDAELWRRALTAMRLV